MFNPNNYPMAQDANAAGHVIEHQVAEDQELWLLADGIVYPTTEAAEQAVETARAEYEGEGETYPDHRIVEYTR